MASAQDARCLLLVFASDSPVGCAFAVRTPQGPRLLTCAHVVNAALGLDERAADLPTARLLLAPWFAREQIVAARVVQWEPIAADGAADFALLEPLDRLPESVVAAPLQAWGGRPGLGFQVLGFPSGYKAVGQHAIGTMTGRFGPRGQWVQLDGETSRGARITRGFSGSPVWDSVTQSVVGMVVAEDLRDTTSPCGAMLPIEVIASAFEPVRTALVVVAHPLAALARHIAPSGAFPRVRDLAASAVGATATVYDQGRGESPYVARDVDERLRMNLDARTFVLITGASKAGKTRTAWEATRAVCGEAVLVEPRDRGALVQLVADDVAHLSGEPVVVWLDELDRFLEREGERGLDLDLLLLAASRSPAWRFVATVRDQPRFEGREALGAAWRRILNWQGAAQLVVPAALAQRERVDAALAYPDEDFWSGAGIGERLIAGPDLVHKLDRADDALGWALTRAAIDCVRTGCEELPLLDDLARLAPAYLPVHADAGDPEAIRQAIEWMLTPAVSHVALVELVERGERWAVRPLDYVVAVTDGQGDRRPEPVRPEAWEWATHRSEGAELFGVISRALTRRDQAGIMIAAAKGRETLQPRPLAAMAAGLLGAQLVRNRRFAEALTPLREAAADDNPTTRAHACVELGRAHAELGDAGQAMRDYEAVIATEHGHSVEEALIALGKLHEERGDDEAALASYERACARTEPSSVSSGWFHRALLLSKRGDSAAAARAALEVALLDATSTAWLIAGGMAADADDKVGADRCYARAVELAGDEPEVLAAAAHQRGRLHADDDPETARAAYRLALERGAGRSAGAAALALADLATDVTQQRELLERAVQSETPEIVTGALLALAHMHAHAGDDGAAFEAIQRCRRAGPQALGREGLAELAQLASALGHLPDAAALYEQASALPLEPEAEDSAVLGLVRVRMDQGRHEEALELLRAYVGGATGEAKFRATELMGKALLALGDVEEGLRAYSEAAAHPGYSGRSARERLGLELWLHDRGEQALDVLQPLLEDADERLRAHANLITARILDESEPAAALEALRRVIATDHLHCVSEARLKLGRRAEEDGDVESAVEHYRAAYDAGQTRDSADAALRLNELLPRLGRLDAAVDVLTGLSPDLDVGGRVAFQLGMRLHERQQLNRALRRFEDALDAAEDAGDALIVGLAGSNAATLLQHAGEPEAAARTLRRVVAGGDAVEAVDAALQLAGDAFTRGDHDDAEQLLHTAIDRADGPPAAKAWVELGGLLCMRGRVADARTALRRAQEAGAAGLEPRMALLQGALALGEGDLPRAEEAFTRALAGEREHAELAAYNLALVALRRGEVARACDELRRLTTSEVHQAAHMSVLALAEVLEPDDPASAISLLEDLARAEPFCGHAQQAAATAGSLLYDEPGRARSLLNRAITGPSPVVADSARLELALHDRVGGDLTRAIEGLRSAMESADRDTAAVARANLADALIDVGSLEEAETLLRPLIETPLEALGDAPGGIYGKLLLRSGCAAEARRWLLDAADSGQPEVRAEALTLLSELRGA